MGLEQSIRDFNRFCEEVENTINLFIHAYDELEEKYNDVLKKLWSAKSDITILQANIQQLENVKNKEKINQNILQDIYQRIDKIEEIVKTLELEFLND